MRDIVAERKIRKLHGVDRALPRIFSRGIVAHNEQSVRAPIAQAGISLQQRRGCEPQREIDEQYGEDAARGEQGCEKIFTAREAA